MSLSRQEVSLGSTGIQRIRIRGGHLSRRRLGLSAPTPPHHDTPTPPRRGTTFYFRPTLFPVI